MPDTPADIQALEDALDATERDARALTAGLSEQEAEWRAAEGTWSISECLDHLATANRVYLKAMGAAALRARERGRFRRRPAVPGFVGRWFVRTLEPPVTPRFRMKAPRSILPRTAPPIADAFEGFLASQADVRSFLRDYADIDLAGVHFVNPFIRGVRFSLATGLHVIAAHERRHLWQAWRVARDIERRRLPDSAGRPGVRGLPRTMSPRALASTAPQTTARPQEAHRSTGSRAHANLRMLPIADYAASVLNSADDPIICNDREGRITSWNPAAERILGYAAAEVIGRDVSLLFPREAQLDEAATLVRILNGEQATSSDRVLVAKNGQRVELSVTISPIRDAAGGITGASKICRSVGDRRRLAIAALHLGAIVASSDDVIISKDLDGTVQSWNPAAERLFGFTAAEMIGQSIRKIIPAERQAEEDDVLAQVRAGVVVDHFETQRQAKDGALIDISLTVSPIRDGAGRIIGASKLARDIRDQKRIAVAALHLAALVHSSDDAIVSKDLNGIVQSWNPAAERLFGYGAAEMIGQSITKIVPANRLDEEAYVLGRIRAGLSVEHFETLRQTKDGRLVDISLTVSPIRDAAGKVIGASKIVRDIREHKRLVEERLAATASEEAARREVLEEQNRRIQEAARLKSEFVANMSHELRTPLNSIVGFAELIADARFGPLPDRYQHFAHVMNSSAQHLLQLINDILDLAKVESGKIDFQPEDVNLSQLVSETTAIVSGLAAKRKIQMTTHVDPAIGIVRLDPMRLKQVLYNYLSNAIKFTAEGGRVALRVRPDGGERFRLEVEDTGIGIKPEDEHRLFIEFQQLDASTAKKFAGSGLGLALTKRLVEAQGGTVGVRSVFGEGSTFFATLPRYVTADTADITVRVAARVP